MVRPRPYLALLLVAAFGCNAGGEQFLAEAEPAPSGESGPVEAVATPEITVNGDLVTITCPTEGAHLFYTLDGSAPSNRSNIYSGPFFVSLDATILQITAIATKSGYADSALATRAIVTVSSGYSEDFTVNPGWTVTNEGTGNIWRWEPAGYYRIDFSDVSQIEDSKLISPSLALSLGFQNYLLQFDEIWHGGYPGYWSEGEVLVSTNGGASWDRLILLHYDTGQGTYTVTQQVVLDLSAYRGQTVQIAFRYHGNYDWDWTIDNFALVGSN